jgi:hypothetical protein
MLIDFWSAGVLLPSAAGVPFVSATAWVARSNIESIVSVLRMRVFMMVFPS